jgi:hypothetical protein
LNSATFSTDLLAIFILRSCAAFWWRDMKSIKPSQWFIPKRITLPVFTKVLWVSLWYLMFLQCMCRTGTAQSYSAGLRAQWSGILVPAGTGNFLFTTTSRLVLTPTQSLIQWVPGALSPSG